MYNSFDESETSERLGQTRLLKAAARSINFLLLSNNNNIINNDFIYFLSRNGFRRLQIKLNHIKSNQMFVFRERGKPDYREKPSHKRVENQQTQSASNGGSGNRTRAILMEGEFSDHCANPSQTAKPLVIKE